MIFSRSCVQKRWNGLNYKSSLNSKKSLQTFNFSTRFHNLLIIQRNAKHKMEIGKHTKTYAI